MVVEVIDLEMKMKKRKVEMVGIFEEGGDVGVVGDGGEEMRPPEMGFSPATWPEVVAGGGGR